MKPFFYIALVILSYTTLAQDTIYKPIQLIKETFSYSYTNSYSGKKSGSRGERWYFRDGNGPEQRIDWDGANLKRAMKGCDECYKHLDSLRFYSKRGKRKTLTAFGTFLLAVGGLAGGAIIMDANAAPYNGFNAREQEVMRKKFNRGGFLFGAGIVSVGCTIYFASQQRKNHYKYWPNAVKRSVTLYNQYLKTYNTEN